MQQGQRQCIFPISDCRQGTTGGLDQSEAGLAATKRLHNPCLIGLVRHDESSLCGLGKGLPDDVGCLHQSVSLVGFARQRRSERLEAQGKGLDGLVAALLGNQAGLPGLAPHLVMVIQRVGLQGKVQAGGGCVYPC